jgi:uroporphyrinogen-III synthase
VLLVSWPTVTPVVLMAAHEWGRGKPIVFIGEITDHTLGRFGFGSCATDEFFEAVTVERAFDTYKGNMIEAAVVYHLK